jgi:hypothetical protein
MPQPVKPAKPRPIRARSRMHVPHLTFVRAGLEAFVRSSKTDKESRGLTKIIASATTDPTAWRLSEPPGRDLLLTALGQRASVAGFMPIRAANRSAVSPPLDHCSTNAGHSAANRRSRRTWFMPPSYTTTPPAPRGHR